MRTRGRLALCMLCLSLVSARLPAMDFDHEHAAFSALLRRHVVVLPGEHASRVDYRGLAVEHDALNRYLQTLSGVSRAAFERFSRPQQMAFLINAYNGYTLALVLRHYPVDSIKDIGDWFSSPWKQTFIHLLDEDVSLDHIEHTWLREPGRYDDLRVHFAVNCASVGCPMLREEAYVPDRLDAQLEAQTQRFLGDRSRNGVVDGRLRVSPIFKWYVEDWQRGARGIAGTLPVTRSVNDFLARYAERLADGAPERAAIAAGRLALIASAYDWALNDAR